MTVPYALDFAHKKRRPASLPAGSLRQSPSVLAGDTYRDFVHGITDGEARRLGTRGEFLEAFQPLRDDGLRGYEQERTARLPVAVVDAGSATLERIGPQIVEIGPAQRGEVALPHTDGSLGVRFGVLLHEGDFPFADTERHQLAVVAPVEELLAWRVLHVALEEGHEVLAVEVNLEGFAVQRGARLQLVDQGRLARRCSERRDEVLVRADVVDDRSSLDHARPSDQAGHAEGALPVGCLLALERGCAAIGPGKDFGAVVSRIVNVRDIGATEIVDEFE